MDENIVNRLRYILGIVLIFFSLLLVSGCSAEKDRLNVAQESKVESNTTSMASVDEEPVTTQTDTIASGEAPVTREPVSEQIVSIPEETIHEQPVLKPTLPEGVFSELILKSRPIPGKPIIAIYKVWESDSSEERPDKTPEQEIDLAIKPEPTIAIEPKPMVVEKQKPTIAIEPKPMVVEKQEPTIAIEPKPMVVEKQEPTIAIEPKPMVIEKQEPTIATEPKPMVVEKQEPIIQPVIKPENADTTVPVEHEQIEQPEITPNPAVLEKPESSPQNPIIADTNPPHIGIRSPDGGSFYTHKIKIEGQIASSSDNLESVHGIGKVTWEIAGKKAPEEIFFGSDGIFFLSFSAKEYSGTIDVLIKAEKVNGASIEHKLTLFDGNVKPKITLKSPSKGSSYGAAIRISGNVTDPSAASLNLSGPSSLEYSLFPIANPSTSNHIFGTIPVKSDGSFSTVIFSNDFSGEQLVTITAHGRNGKTQELSITIVEAESDIPGFIADQTDGVVTLSWDSLPGIESYNLFYADERIDPAGTDGSKFADVKSPVLIRNFREGFLYRFQLEAVPLETDNSTEKTFWSDIAETIILTSDTLKPTTTSGYQQISLVWLNIPGTETFDILKREGSAGSFKILEQAYKSTTYIDMDVVFGKKYSYKIRPSLKGGQISKIVTVESLPFPEEKTVVISGFGSYDLQDIEVAGSYIFLANGTGGVKIIDNSDPSNPLEVGRYPAEETKGIIIRGERAYVADGFRGIKIIDISDPGNPLLLGSRKTIDATKLAIKGNTLFIADGKAGIKIIDITSERRPLRTGSLKTSFAKDLVLLGSELFVADGPGGLKILDIADSPNLKLTSKFLCNDAVAIAVTENTVYLADNGFGVRIINTSDSGNPMEIGQIPMDNITDILVNKNYIFVSDLSEGLLIYEISDPRRPVLFDAVGFNAVSALTLNDGIIYLTDKEGFKTVESFTTGRSFVIAEYQTDGNAYSLSYIDQNLYLSDHENGVKIIDASTPTDSSSFYAAHELKTTYAESVVGYGSKLLIADGAGGLTLGEISYSDDGAQQIEIKESIDLPGITKSLVVYKNKAFIAAREEGMHILNLETKSIETIYTGGSVQEIAVTEALIFIADGSKGLRIYSNKETEIPKLISTIRLPNVVTVAVADGYVIAGGRDGLSVIDVSLPEKPVIVSSFRAGWIEDIHLEPGYIYAAAGYEGLFVLNMKSPEELVLVSSCKDVYAVGVEVEKDLAFVADVDGFKVVKILIPSWLQ